MDVSYQKMQDGAFDHRMDELPVVVVCKGTEFLDESFDRREIGRRVQDIASEIKNPDLIVVPEPSFVVRVFERIPGDGLVDLQNQLRCQFFVFYLGDPLHRDVVVQDHPLVFRGGLPPFAEHLFCNRPRDCGSFDLTRCNRLFHQGVGDELVPILGERIEAR